MHGDQEIKVSNAGPAKAPEEFERGFQEGLVGAPSKPTSLDYVRGYEKGVEVRELKRSRRTA